MNIDAYKTLINNSLLILRMHESSPADSAE